MKTKKNRLVVADSGWAESIPDYIKESIREERMIYGLMDIMKRTQTVGDAEVLAYLYTANLRGVVSHNLSEVFIYLTGKIMQKVKKIEINNLPDFVRSKVENGLTSDEERELNDLKRELYRLRGGEINHPLLNVMREFNKVCKRKSVVA